MMGIKEISPEETWEIRHKEMWPNKSLDFVKLPKDQHGLHWGLFVDGELVSVISLFPDGEKAQFRKFATLKAYQGHGYGSALLGHMISRVSAIGGRELWCNARVDKAGFYRRFGMGETGQFFKKEGQEYVVMKLRF